MLRLFFVVVAMFFCTAQAKDDRETSIVDEKAAEEYGRSLKEKVAPETIERMNTLIQANNAKDCWEFAVVKTKDKMDGAICFFDQYPKLVECALPHAQALISKANSFKEANDVWVIGVGIVAAINRDYKLSDKMLEWVKARTAQIAKTNPELPRIKKEFNQAIQQKDAKAADNLVTECIEIGFGKPCNEMKDRMEKEIAKWADEENKREEQEEKKRVLKKVIALKKVNDKYLPQAMSLAKQAVLNTLNSPSTARWVSTKLVVGLGPLYGFYLTFDAQNAYGVFIRGVSCLIVCTGPLNDGSNEMMRMVLQHVNTKDCSKDVDEASDYIKKLFDDAVQKIRESDN